MSEQLLILDGNSVENLFTAAGEQGWDLLKAKGLRVVVPQFVLDEIRPPEFLSDGSPNPNFTVKNDFVNWIARQGGNVVIVDYNPFAGIDPLPTDAGDKAIRVRTRSRVIART